MYFKAVQISSSLLIGLGLLFNGCEKSDALDSSSDSEYNLEEANLEFASSNYETIVEVPFYKPDDFEYYTEGLVKYIDGDKILAEVDYGNGEKDDIVYITSKGSKHKWIPKKNKKSGITKIIVKPLIKTDDCDYIVEGIIEFWKNGKLIATIDYGNGDCDEWAIKIVGDKKYKIDLSGKSDKDKGDKDKSKGGKDGKGGK